MFVIRQRHVDALQAARHDDFLRRAMRSLRARFDDARAAPDEDLRAFCDAGLTDGERWGLYGEAEVMTLLEYRVLCGDAFPDGEDDAWALAILEDDTLDVDVKLERLDTQFAELSLAGERAAEDPTEMP